MGINPILPLAALAVAYNALVFGVYWWDKRAARNGSWRVRESTLLLMALTAGGPGALAAQRLLRHKTRKPPFNFALPLFFVLQMAWLFLAITVPESAITLLEKLGLG